MRTEARLDFLTPALHYGVAAFEGIRCYRTARGPAIFRLQDHLERLVHSALVLGWRSLPYDLAQLTEGCKDVVRASGFGECYIRPLIWLAEGGWNLTVDGGKAHAGIAVWEWKAYLGAAALEHGVLAKTESLRLGFDEAIMLDVQGMVAECTGENIFLVRKGKLYTPPPGAILEGITRDSIMTLARDFGYEVIEQSISRDQLYIADEVFVTGTAAEVIGLREIDFRTIGSAGGTPVTRALQRAYHAVVRGEHARSKDWLTSVG